MDNDRANEARELTDAELEAVIGGVGTGSEVKPGGVILSGAGTIRS
jgi:bacteriocin-like protein